MAILAGVAGREPEIFGGYLLFEKIAEGGMAAVFLAEPKDDPTQQLAVKRVHPHLTEREDVRQMFLNEARILSRLDHPNIAGILDYGLEGDVPYIVMRYLDGQPLSALIRRLLDLQRPAPVELMAHVAAKVAAGLHYAHEAEGEHGPLGLVHRDVSPQNIFITFAGEVKLLDFGVAHADGYDGLTGTGHVKGKDAYASPEQVAGEAVDRRSDIFSLGVVLWESLTGKHLFKPKRGHVAPPSELNAAVPAELDRIVENALAFDPVARFQTAAEMEEALGMFLSGGPEPRLAETLAEAFST